MKQGHGKQGMSMVETVIAIGLLVLMLPTILYFLWNGFNMNRRVGGQIVNQQQARRAMDKLHREIREASYGDDDQVPLQTCGALEIAFFSDFDLDGDAERLRYYISGDVLKRGIIEPAGDPATYPVGNEYSENAVFDILNDASDPLFYYYNNLYTGSESALSQPVTCSEVTMVGINFKIDTVVEHQPGPFYLISMVQLRNLKNNL